MIFPTTNREVANEVSNMTTENQLTHMGLNWNVSREKIITESGIVLPNVALVRDDTRKVLSVRGEGYEVYQNKQMIDLLYKVADQTGLKIHGGGFFGDGEKVFIQLKGGTTHVTNVGGKKDDIESYYTGVNSFDGSTSLGFGLSTTTISCLNTFFAAYKGATKARHTANMHVKIEDILKSLKQAQKDEVVMFQQIKKLSETGINEVFGELSLKEVVEKSILHTLFDIPQNINISETINAQMLAVKQDDSKKIISTRKENQIVALMGDMNTEITQKGETLWGLMSGITRFTTHTLNNSDNTKDKMFGNYGERERQIFSKLVELV